MASWRASVTAFVVAMVGAILGALWSVAKWPDADVVGNPFLGIALAFFLLGALAQRWLSAGLTVALAACMLAGLLIAADMAEDPDDNDGQEGGEDTGYVIVQTTLLLVAFPMALALLGHWAMGAARVAMARRARRS